MSCLRQPICFYFFSYIGLVIYSIDDKKLFKCEYKDLTNKIDKSLKILGDKGYAGLGKYQLSIPIKRNE